MWRYRELMPLENDEAPVTLGEGGTPLLEVDLEGDLSNLRIMDKDEGQNPTGSFKDRGLCAAVTRAVRDGALDFVVPTAGNAGASLAAYAARAGVSAQLFMPTDTPEGVARRWQHYGATIVRVNGLIDECGRLSAEYSETTGAFNVSTLKEPYRIEGKKTMMLEIIEALKWRAPDAIVYPTGGGTGIVGMWKAFQEMEDLGWISSKRPKMFVVQAENCAPIVRAFQNGDEFAEPWQNASTMASGIRVPSAIGDYFIVS